MVRSPPRHTPKKFYELLKMIPKHRVILGITALVSLSTIGLSEVGAFRKLNFQVHDVLLDIRGSESLSDQITVVEVDDASYDRFGWPIPRDVYGAIIHMADGLGMKAIGFDILFRDPSPEPEADTVFAASINASKRVVLPSGYDVPISSHQPQGLYLIEASRHPIAPLAMASTAPAHLLVDSEIDGVARRVNLALQTPGNGDRVPALALALLEADGESKAIWTDDNALDISVENQPRRQVPIDTRGRAFINYRYVPGQSDSAVPPTIVSFERIYDAIVRFSEDEPEAREELTRWFQDKYVLIGPSAQDVGDRSPLPNVHEAPMMYAHANTLDNLLEDRFLSQLDAPIVYGLTILMAALTSILVLATPTGISAAVAFGLSLGCAVTSHFALKEGFVFDIIDINVALIMSFSVTSLYRRLVVEREARLALEAFQRFVSPHVLDQLKDNPELLNMQGHRRYMSVLFSDIVGYTALSNALQENEIVELLRRYLGPMLDTILEHDGTVDKVNGDGIMAFFGDPIRQDNSPMNAVACAQAMHVKLNALNREWESQGLPTLQIRVGIASGEVYCGNFGSENYVEYTVIGPPVNLAARLEAKASVGTSMVCRRTYKAVREHHQCRLVTQIRLKGFSQPQSAYEVIPDAMAAKKDSRRKHQRLSLTTPFRVRAVDGTFEGDALNISEGGIYITASSPLDLGIPVQLNTFLEGDENLSLIMEGIVKHDRPDEFSGKEGYGIEFVRLISDSPDIIEHAMELLIGELKSLEAISEIESGDGKTRYGIEAKALTGKHPTVS